MACQTGQMPHLLSVRVLIGVLIGLFMSLPLRAEEVDVELLLLVDVFRSMLPGELEIQRCGLCRDPV